MMQSSDFDTKISPISKKTIPNNPKKLSQKINNPHHEEKKRLDNLDRYSYQKKLEDASKSYSESELEKITNEQHEEEKPIHLHSEKGLDSQTEEYSEEISVSVDNSAVNNNALDKSIKPRGFLPVLRNQSFLALWSGQVFSQLADKVYLVLMIAIINASFQDTTETISGWVSALMMAFTIPAILFGSLAGVFVDRWSKKEVLVATNFCRGILVLIIPLLLWLSNDIRPVAGILPFGFLIILGITFLVSTLTQFFAPAEQAAIPLIVQEQDLLSANSLYTTTMMASVIVGFAVGEPLLAAVDSLWSQFIGGATLGKEILVGGSYTLAGLILMSLITKEKYEDHEIADDDPMSAHPFKSAIADLKDGFIYLQNNQRLRNALIELVILFSVIAALTVSAIRLAEVIPNLKPEQFGFLLASGGIGIAIGAAILGQFGQFFSYTQLSLWGCVGMALSLSALSLFTTQLWIVLLLIAGIGIFGSFIGIPMQTTIQTETPANMRGKVFGLQNNIVNIALSLPLALAGIAETFVGLNAVFLGLAAFVLLGILLTRHKSYE